MTAALAITRRGGTIWRNAIENPRVVEPMLRAVRCARPVHALTAKIEPGRSHTKFVTAESAAKASWPSRTVRIVENESHQFRNHAVITITTAKSIKRIAVRSGLGIAFVETK